MKNIVPEVVAITDAELHRPRRNLLLLSFVLSLLALSRFEFQTATITTPWWQMQQPALLFVLLWLAFFYCFYRFVTRLQAVERTELYHAWLLAVFHRCNPVISEAPYSDQLSSVPASRCCDSRFMQWLFRLVDQSIGVSKDTSLRCATNREKLRAGVFTASVVNQLVRGFVVASLLFVLTGKLFADYLMPILIALLVMIYAMFAPWGGAWWVAFA